MSTQTKEVYFGLLAIVVAAGSYIPLAAQNYANCCATSATAYRCDTTAGVPTPAGP